MCEYQLVWRLFFLYSAQYLQFKASLCLNHGLSEDISSHDRSSRLHEPHPPSPVMCVHISIALQRAKGPHRHAYRGNYDMSIGFLLVEAVYHFHSEVLRGCVRRENVKIRAKQRQYKLFSHTSSDSLSSKSHFVNEVSV